ncbi:MAG: rhodanese-like domain-containing protein, partial [Alphaproteobacteria bacterium]|nr:rhodanese-like domain-containing protein [Alphaproteobacteria bacterium]
MAITKGIEQLLAAARAKIEEIPAAEALALQNDDSVQIVDIRDVRELDRDGMIPGALHAPRGMLEFWVDPASPYHRDVFASGKKFVFYCASGWRSALATETLQDMGLEPVAHSEGGF